MTPLCPTCGQPRLSTYSTERIRSDMQPGLRRVYHAIVALWRELGAFPTTEMVADRVGLRSRRTVFVHLRRLIEKGYVTHEPALPPSHRFRLRVLPEGEPMPTKKSATKKPAKTKKKEAAATAVPTTPLEVWKAVKRWQRGEIDDDEMRDIRDALANVDDVEEEKSSMPPLNSAERDLLKRLLERVLGRNERQPTPPLTQAELQRECREFVSQALTGIVGDAASPAWIGGDDDDEPCCEMVELSEDLQRFVTLRLGVPCVD